MKRKKVNNLALLGPFSESFPHKQMLTGSTASTTRGFTLIYTTAMGVLEQTAAQIHSDMLVQFRQIQRGRSSCLLRPTAVWQIHLFTSANHGHFFHVMEDYSINRTYK